MVHSNLGPQTVGHWYATVAKMKTTWQVLMTQLKSQVGVNSWQFWHCRSMQSLREWPLAWKRLLTPFGQFMQVIMHLCRQFMQLDNYLETAQVVCLPHGRPRRTSSGWEFGLFLGFPSTYVKLNLRIPQTFFWYLRTVLKNFLQFFMILKFSSFQSKYQNKLIKN